MAKLGPELKQKFRSITKIYHQTQGTGLDANETESMFGKLRSFFSNRKWQILGAAGIVGTIAYTGIVTLAMLKSFIVGSAVATAFSAYLYRAEVSRFGAGVWARAASVCAYVKNSFGYGQAAATDANVNAIDRSHSSELPTSKSETSAKKDANENPEVSPEASNNAKPDAVESTVQPSSEPVADAAVTVGNTASILEFKNAKAQKADNQTVCEQTVVAQTETQKSPAKKRAP